MRDDVSKYSKHELEAEKRLEERFKREGFIDTEAERKAWEATDNTSGGGRRSDTRTGDREHGTAG